MAFGDGYPSVARPKPPNGYQWYCTLPFCISCYGHIC